MKFQFPNGIKEIFEVDSDQDLFDHLSSHMEILIQFILDAMDDETWSISHAFFYKLSFQYLTQRLLEDRLSQMTLIKLMKGFKRHFSIIDPMLPKPFKLVAKGFSIELSPLIIGSVSSVFYNWCRESQLRQTIDADPRLVEFIFQSIVYNMEEEIGLLSKLELETILELVEKWDIIILRKILEKKLAHFYNSQNLIEELIKAEKRNRKYSLAFAIEFFNSGHEEIKIFLSDYGGIGLEFFDLKENSINIYQELKNELTCLAFRGNLSLHSSVPLLLDNARKLNHLDISNTDAFSLYLLNMPKKIINLSLANCRWLDDDLFARICKASPQIQRINLNSDTELQFRGFGQIKQLQKVIDIKVANCIQIDAKILEIILDSAPNISSLNISNCHQISQEGLDLLNTQENLRELSLSGLMIEDLYLVNLGKSIPIEKISLDQCSHLTEKGIYDFLMINKI